MNMCFKYGRPILCINTTTNMHEYIVPGRLKACGLDLTKLVTQHEIDDLCEQDCGENSGVVEMG